VAASDRSAGTGNAGAPMMALAGTTVVDISNFLAAPMCTMFLADFGADVVKVERPGAGDEVRRWGEVKNGVGLYYKAVNRGKKSVTADLRTPLGVDVVKRLVANADILVENYRTGTLEKWGLAPDVLMAINPGLIVLRITGFGQTGPYARRPGFARIFEAMSGFTHLTGEAGGPPQHMNFPLGDAIAGLFGAFAIATALAERNAKPKAEQQGVEIDLSATEAMMRLLDPLAAEYKFSGVARSRTGSRAGYTAPSNVYQTADGIWITLVGSSDPIFARLCRAMEREDVGANPAFASNVRRTQNLVAIDDIVADWCSRLTFAQLRERLEREEVPFSKVYSIADAQADPHFKARGTTIELMDPVLGAIPAPAAVPRFTGRKAGVPCVGPDTGQHNAQIYAELGLQAAQLNALVDAKVI
jgi:crotonobetainyl-CoA:carnitine CoA-transferase CaiB-like acyl-CoA transferase